jgi:hypothetical protein
MARITNKIPAFFILLAALALNAHMVIPHDHHPAESNTGKDDTCPVSNDNTTHHKSFPIHCHAFNDLASEKASVPILKKNTQLNNISICSFSKALLFESSVLIITIFDIQKSFPDFYLLELPLLRAPPDLG